MFDLFTEKVVHFQLFLDYILQFFHIGIDIKVNIANTLHL